MSPNADKKTSQSDRVFFPSVSSNLGVLSPGLLTFPALARTKAVDLPTPKSGTEPRPVAYLFRCLSLTPKMAAPAQHQGTAPGLPTPPAAPRAPHRRVNVPAPPSPGHAGNNNNGQQPGRPPGGPRPHQPQGNQPIPHPAVARLRPRRRRRVRRTRPCPAIVRCS